MIVAPNGPADPIERCLLLEATQKTSALSEYFAFWTRNRHTFGTVLAVRAASAASRPGKSGGRQLVKLAPIDGRKASEMREAAQRGYRGHARLPCRPG